MLRFTEEQKMNKGAGVASGPGSPSDPVAVVGAALDEQVARIRELNDRLRVTGRGGMILMTDGIASLGREAVEKVFDAVRRFNRFDEDNDPTANTTSAAWRSTAGRCSGRSTTTTGHGRQAHLILPTRR